jgi:hypothetical protein
VQQQAAGPRAAESGNFFTRLFSDGEKTGSAQAPTGSVSHTASNEKKAAPSHAAPKPAQVANTKPTPAAASAIQAGTKPAPQPQYAAAKPLPPATDGSPKPGSGDAGLLSNQPTAPAGSFDSRWGTGR